MKKQKENSHQGITWSEMGKQNVQAEKVYYNAYTTIRIIYFFSPALNLHQNERITPCTTLIHN